MTPLIAGAAYTWTDAQGQVHFGDRPPAGRPAEQLDIRVNTYSAPAEVKRQAQSVGHAGQVVIYTTEQCGYCRKAKQFFSQHRIPYSEYDVQRTNRGRDDFRKLNGRGVPIILVGEQRMDGYSEPALGDMLRAAGYDL